MIDIHSHVLPGVDDGARSFEESLQMLHLAAAAGTTDIVATPHASPEFDYDEPRIEALFKELSEQTRGVISLHLGCDFHLSYKNLIDALAHPTKYTIDHGRYLMVELPDLISFSTVREGLRQLIRIGVTPVITHPERNMSLQQKSGELMRWIQDGCTVQVTGQSFLGHFGPVAKAVSDKLIGANSLHFVASDAHDCIDRPPDLSGAFKYLSEKYSPECAELVCIGNPDLLLNGEPVSLDLPLERKSLSFLAFAK